MKCKHILRASLLALFWVGLGLGAWGQSTDYDVRSFSGVYFFSLAQTPANIVSLNSAAVSGSTFQWEYSTTVGGSFQNVSGATAENLVFSSALADTRFYRRKAVKGGITYYSNVVRYELVSASWEDMNYIREHVILKSGKTTWLQVDAMVVGDKLVSTTYFDGLGRPVQTVAREAATPVSGTTWGDIVEFHQYDNLGREPKGYLPYSTTINPGKYKTDQLSAQGIYYGNNYSDNKPFSETTFDGSPLHRPLTVKSPGQVWNAGAGNSFNYQLSSASEDIRQFTIGPNDGDRPVMAGTYGDNTLSRQISYDYQGKATISYVNSDGQLILKKVQLSPSPGNTYIGWICTYYVYDDFGRLRCEINPEGVEWLRNNSWNLNTTTGATIFGEQCFVYNYDEKGRTVYKKQPGQQALYMVYDLRDRLVFTQDGNQRLKSPGEWTAYLFDELDRPTISSLYYTSQTLSQLKTKATTIQPVLTAAELANASVCTVLKQVFYDGYDFGSGGVAAAPFDQVAANAAAVIPASSETRPMSKTQRTTGMVTGSKSRVLGSTTFLVSTAYYNEQGAVLQTTGDNLKGGKDKSSVQYGWDGRVLASGSRHGMPGNVMDGYEVLVKSIFDKIGRTTGTDIKVGTNAWRTVATQTFDDLGRVSGKRLDPAYNAHFAGIGPAGGGLENQVYTYDIQGSLIGINKGFALKAGSFNKWSNFFGVYFAYGSNETQSSDTRLNGQMAAQVWTTQGDDAQRRYTYAYDNAGRLQNSVFTQRATPAAGWGSTLNFGESISGGYTLNGNIQGLLRYGFAFGNSAAVSQDNLTYTYQGYSNKLKSVSDNGVAGTMGDFYDGNTGALDDYSYDANGNLLYDLNKSIKNLSGTNGIKYNHLDKPEEIKIDGKGTIKITYDANGYKLKREFISATGQGTKVTWYMGAYQYEEVVGGSAPKAYSLSFLSFSEGRIRAITPQNVNNGYDVQSLDGNLTLPGGLKGSIDYFISDHRSDVRMILTEEVQYSIAKASLETVDNRPTVEGGIFGSQVAATRVAKSTAPGWTSNTSQYVSRLGSATQMTGPGQLMKVMAGDLLSTSVQYYYNQPATNTSTSIVFSSVLNSLIGAIGASPVTPGGVKSGASGIQSSLNTGTPFSHLISPDITSPTGTNPKAYLNIVFFDERFQFVPEASSSQRVSVSGDNAPPLALLNIKAPKNGYCYIYITNESSVAVFFDNLSVRHDRGRIYEENHYYSTGLKITPLSSNAFGSSSNDYLYQGNYADFDLDIGWYDFDLRSYDPQIGRFLQNDPFDQFPSGYVGMGNDWVNLVDPNGGQVGGPGVPGSFLMDGPITPLENVTIVAKRLSPGSKTASMLTGVKTALTAAYYLNRVTNSSQTAFAEGTYNFGEQNLDAIKSIPELPGQVFEVMRKGDFVRSLAADPSGTINYYKGLSEGVVTSYNDFKNADSYRKQVVGVQFAWNIGSLFLGAKTVPALKIKPFVPKPMVPKYSPNITYLVKGKYPSWSTVRRRYWNLMNDGKAPTGRAWVKMDNSGEIKIKKVSKELHHVEGRDGIDPHRFDNLEEVWPWEHQAVDKHRRTGYTFIEWVKE